MSTSFFILMAFLLFTALSNRMNPVSNQSPLEKLSLAILIFIVGLVILLPNQLAQPLAELLSIGRGADLIVYLFMIFTFAMLNSLYRKIRKLETNLNELMREIVLKLD